MHNCSYCYARSLLDFRGLWNAENPRVADIQKIRRKLEKVPPGTILRLGGMTDCFQPVERQEQVTYQTIEQLNEYGIGYLIVTNPIWQEKNDTGNFMIRNWHTFRLRLPALMIRKLLAMKKRAVLQSG